MSLAWVTTNPAWGLPPILERDDPSWLARPDISAFLWPSEEGGGQAPTLGPPREELVGYYERIRSRTTALLDFGVELAVGTDHTLMPNITQLTLRALVDAGMTPLQAITAATLTPARVIGAEADIGSVEVGKLADLVTLEADPLEDIANTERIWRVLKGGVVVDREELLRLAIERRGGPGNH